MKSKRKVLITMLVALFALMAVIATIAIVFALTQQTVKTSLSIDYIAKDVNATIRAEVIYADGTVESMLTADGQTSITFDSESKDPAGGSLLPTSGISLTSDETYVMFPSKTRAVSTTHILLKNTVLRSLE